MLQRLWMFLETLEASPEVLDAADSYKVEQILASRWCLGTPREGAYRLQELEKVYESW
jgi:uncharacterized membrane protein